MIRSRLEERAGLQSKYHYLKRIMACNVQTSGVAMGQSFESMRMGVKDISARWLKAIQARKKEDQVADI